MAPNNASRFLFFLLLGVALRAGLRGLLGLGLFVESLMAHDAVHVDGLGVVFQLLGLLRGLVFDLFQLFFNGLWNPSWNFVAPHAGLHIVAFLQLQGLVVFIVMAFTARGPVFRGVLLVREPYDPLLMLLVGGVFHLENVGDLGPGPDAAGDKHDCHPDNGRYSENRSLFHEFQFPPFPLVIACY